MANALHLLLADDHRLIREALASCLEAEGGFVVTVAEDVAQALVAVAAADEEGRRFDLVLLDVWMPGMEGLKGLETLRQRLPETPIALLSGALPDALMDQALQAGAAGFVPKSISLRGLQAALRLMASGGVYMPIWMVAERADSVQPNLTERERQVLHGLCRGLSNKDIAAELGLQVVTVKLHVKSLLRKTGARSRTHAVTLALHLSAD